MPAPALRFSSVTEIGALAGRAEFQMGVGVVGDAANFAAHEQGEK